MKHKYTVRPEYIAKIQLFIGKQIIKVITGQRRVGKSYLLYQLIDQGIKQINLDDFLMMKLN